MDASSGLPHLGQEAPSLDHQNVDNDPWNEIQEIVSSTSTKALQLSPSSSTISSEPGEFHLTSSKSPRNPLKTQIFLSHSGAQKPFVELLNEDLRREGYLTFFDTDEESLPKGKKFPELIFKAAKECNVAVVVLSKEYLLSKWPMLELATFVDAKKSDNTKMEILPLFYKLGVPALKDDEELKRKKSDTWKKFAEEDNRIDPKKWGEAVHILWHINGQVFDSGCEVAYRKKIVTSIYNLCLPPVQFDLTKMKGKERLCSLVAGELEMRLKERDTAILGRYGMTGLGKTMLCKALCMHYRQKFIGRVCYVDAGSGDVLKMKKEILRRLTDLRSESRLNQLLNEAQVDDALKDYLPRQDVFVAIDNLPREFVTASMACFFESLSKGSLCIVTARSQETLLKLDESLEAATIKPTPSLTEEEAMTFLLHVASPKRPLSSLSSEEWETVKTCVNRCGLNRLKSIFFAEFQVPTETMYHPLTLAALANCMKQAKIPLDPLEWINEEHISEKLDHNDMNSMYEIVEKLYMTLNDANKVLFMDIAVFAPRVKLFDREGLLKWLAGVRDMREGILYGRLKELESLSFLEISEDSVKMHDFYIDFAHYQLQSEADSIRKPFVFKAGGNTLPLTLQFTPHGKEGFWEELVRLKLQASSNHSNPLGSICYVEKDPLYKFPMQKLREWVNLVVLHLDFGGKHIDIGPLTCLRSLYLKAGHNLKTFTCTNRFQQLQFVNFQCMLGQVKEMPSFTSTQLQELEINMSMFALPKAVTLPPASGSLTILHLSQWYSSSRHHVLDVGVFPNLLEMMIESTLIMHSFIGCELSISGLKNLTKLKHLCLRKLPIMGVLHGLENMTGLERLTLQGCSKITSLPGLGSLTNLIALSVSLTAVEKLAGVEQLLKLQELYCIGCSRLQSLPDLCELPDLHVVHVDSSLEYVFVSGSCYVKQFQLEFQTTEGQESVPFIIQYIQDPLGKVRGVMNEAIIAGQVQGVGTDAGYFPGLGIFGPNRRIFAQLPRDSSTTPLFRSNGLDATAERTKDLMNLQLDEMERARSHPAGQVERYASTMRTTIDEVRHSWSNGPIVFAIDVLKNCVILGVVMALTRVILGSLVIVMLVGVLSILIALVTIRCIGKDFVRHVWGSLSIVEKVRDVIFWLLFCLYLSICSLVFLTIYLVFMALRFSIFLVVFITTFLVMMASRLIISVLADPIGSIILLVLVAPISILVILYCLIVGMVWCILLVKRCICRVASKIIY